MIQKKIHFIWPGFDPFPHSKYMLEWKKLHSDWIITLWCPLNYPRDALSKSTLKILDNPEIPEVVKSDVLRLNIVYALGGIFVCADTLCLNNFDNLLDCKSFCGYVNEQKLCNALFGAEQGLKLLKEASDAANESVLKIKGSFTYRDVIDSAGSGGIMKYLKQFEVLHEPYHFYPNLPIVGKKAYSRHMWVGTRAGGWTTKIK